MTEMSPDCKKAYDKFCRDYHGDLSDTTHLAQTMFNAGGRTMAEAMVRFQDVQGYMARMHNQILTILTLLERVAPEDEAEESAEGTG